MTNPYAPPQAIVEDIPVPTSSAVPADRGTRLGAAIIDSLIFVGAVYVPLIVAIVGTGGFEAPVDDDGGFDNAAMVAILVAIAGFVVWGYFTLKFMARNSQSIAKKLMHIKVVRSDGSSVSLGRLIVMRNVVVWILSLIPFFGVVDALFIFGDARQCLHDRIADTIVIKA